LNLWSAISVTTTWFVRACVVLSILVCPSPFVLMAALILRQPNLTPPPQPPPLTSPPAGPIRVVQHSQRSRPIADRNHLGHPIGSILPAHHTTFSSKWRKLLDLPPLVVAAI
jgi:hypothetical protein